MALSIDAMRSGGPRRMGPREAFLVAYERLALLADVASEPAFAVAAVDGTARVVDALLLQDRNALVIGRHSRCGLRLGEASVALRQLAALTRAEEGRPVLHLWDLRTQAPFVTEDQQPGGAVVADGPLYVGVGGYALWFVPVGGPFGLVRTTGADAAWRALPPRTFLDRRPPPAAAARPAAPRAARRAPSSRSGERTYITHLGAPLLMGEGDQPEIGWGTLRLAGPGHKEKCAVSAERLEQGVLIGRYERCGMTVEDSDSGRVSRVHLLVARLGAEVWAIDTASTNGVRRGEQPLAAAVLADADRLSLADVVLEWRRNAHPEA